MPWFENRRRHAATTSGTNQGAMLLCSWLTAELGRREPLRLSGAVLPLSCKSQL